MQRFRNWWKQWGATAAIMVATASLIATVLRVGTVYGHVEAQLADIQRRVERIEALLMTSPRQIATATNHQPGGAP
ncbi:MAG: hypothetical protein KBD01_19890 [Acidobacteria bacterium]|nr:hypothetical protein [Acidobacteriota bacterium]